MPAHARMISRSVPMLIVAASLWLPASAVMAEDAKPPASSDAASSAGQPPATPDEIAPSAGGGDPAADPSTSPKAVIAAKTEWPCVWRKVVSIDAATIWDGPPIDAKDNNWRKDDALRTLSQYLVSRRVTMEEADAAIKKFADGQKADERDKKLMDLFNAVLTRTNEDRKQIISGIERFNKRQIQRAEEIEKEGVDLTASDEQAATDAGAGVAGTLPDKEEKYKWEVRVFQEKQQNIPIACEIPQLMDERAGAVARSIRALMKS